MARCLGSEAQVVILPNGLAVAYQKVASSVECLGVAIMAGSRDESDGEFGLATLSNIQFSKEQNAVAPTM